MKKRIQNRWLVVSVVVLFLTIVAGGALGAWLIAAGQTIFGSLIVFVFALPVFGFVAISLVVLGAAAPRRSLIDRESLLWSWIDFMGRSSAGVLVLVMSSLLGGFLGSLFIQPVEQWSVLFAFVLTLVGAWFVLIAILWTFRASMDVARIGDQRERIIRAWLKKSGAKRPKRKAVVFAIGSDVSAVLVAGVAILMLILFAVWAGLILLGFAT